eukprot:4954436-Pyramimonas_sp.AAC.1
MARRPPQTRGTSFGRPWQARTLRHCSKSRFATQCPSTFANADFRVPARAKVGVLWNTSIEETRATSTPSLSMMLESVS